MPQPQLTSVTTIKGIVELLLCIQYAMGVYSRECFNYLVLGNDS